MDWSNLTLNKCPKCSKDLTENATFKDGLFECACGFKIREARYKEIVANMKSKEMEQAWGGESINDFYD